MGNPEKRRAVYSMLRRWERDLCRLEALYGGYGDENFDGAAEMQRNLGSAIEAARGEVGHLTPRVLAKETQ